MAKAKLYDKLGNPKGEIELPPEVFDRKPKPAVVWQYVKVYLANQRLGTHSAKTRSEVRGGGRKPWRQKGTGRARHGSIRSPIWRHGGVAHPPKPRDHRLRMPKKMKRIALYSVLSDRAKENLVHVFEGFELEAPRTKEMLNILNNAGIDISRKTLIITDEVNPIVVKSADNIKNVRVTHTGELNAYQAITSENLIIEKSAIERLKELCRV